MWDFIVKLIDADKLAGWVRALVAAAFGILLAKAPFLQAFVSPELQTTVAIAISTAVVGLWSHIAKTVAPPT